MKFIKKWYSHLDEGFRWFFWMLFTEASSTYVDSPHMLLFYTGVETKFNSCDNWQSWVTALKGKGWLRHYGAVNRVFELDFGVAGGGGSSNDMVLMVVY